MNRRPIGLGFVVVLSLTSVASTISAGEIRWLSDVDEGWQVTQAQSRPMLLFVTQAGCKYCIKMKRNTYADDGVVDEVNEAFVPVMIDSAVATRVLKNIKIHAYPTTLVISPDAVLLDRIEGYVPPRKLSQRLSAAQQKQEVVTRQ